MQFFGAVHVFYLNNNLAAYRLFKMGKRHKVSLMHGKKDDQGQRETEVVCFKVAFKYVNGLR